MSYWTNWLLLAIDIYFFFAYQGRVKRMEKKGRWVSATAAAAMCFVFAALAIAHLYAIIHP